VRPKSVLIVDDTADTVDLLAYCIQSSGCDAVTAYNGLEAVKQAQRHKPDLIFMDIRMPVMDGYEATRQILSIPELASTPIVAMSAHCEGEWRERAIAAGCKDCIPKPTMADAFCDLIEQYIDSC
jgi:CheY-like chemotaxis protein